MKMSSSLSGRTSSCRSRMIALPKGLEEFQHAVEGARPINVYLLTEKQEAFVKWVVENKLPSSCLVKAIPGLTVKGAESVRRRIKEKLHP